jgi:DNA polymerase I-like protein with 3'-5' exonuclease and polymerase domains
MRANLPDGDPNQYDIHSNVAVKAFRLDCPASKAGLKAIGRAGLRIAAKNIIFGVGYGRSAEACSRQAQEEGVDVTTADAQAIIEAIFEMYSGIPRLQDQLRERVLSHGWMRTYFGRLRRVYQTDDEAVLSAQQREFLNFPMQALVADAMSQALHYLYTHPRKAELGYKIVLQLHDSVMLEVPIRSLDTVYSGIIPECLEQRVGFKSCNLAGVPHKDSPVYHFGADRKVCFRWGESLSWDDCDQWKIDRKYGSPPKNAT